MNFSHVQLLFMVNCYRWNLALQWMSLQRAKLFRLLKKGKSSVKLRLSAKI
jgi:hypothetical protein